MARLGADAFQFAAVLADDDAFLRVTLEMDGRLDFYKLAFFLFFKRIYGDGRSIGNLFSG